jgi:hypothetical protein
MHTYIFFLFLCHHGEYSCEFLHATKLFTWGLGFMMQCNKQIFYFLFNAMLMQGSKHAKGKLFYAMQKSKYG